MSDIGRTIGITPGEVGISTPGTEGPGPTVFPCGTFERNGEGVNYVSTEWTGNGPNVPYILAIRFKLAAAGNVENVWSYTRVGIASRWHIYDVMENGDIRMNQNDGTGAVLVTFAAGIVPGQWYALMVVEKSISSRAIFLQQQLFEDSTTGKWQSSSNQYDLSVGARVANNPGGQLGAQVCDLQFYRNNTGITSIKQADYDYWRDNPGVKIHEAPSSPIVGTERVSQAYDDGSGNTVTDYSGNTFNGTWNTPSAAQWANTQTFFPGYS